MKPTIIRRFGRATIAAALTLFVGSCGGGSHGGGIGGTGFVFGAITGLGSVIVNGVTFDTTSAIITRDGEAATEAELALGMIVTIEGALNDATLTGIADTIAITTLLEGPLEALAPDLTTASVLSTTIVFGADTVVEDLLVDVSAIGKTVEVSGFVDASGNIRVSRIVGKESISDLELAVSGIIENVDTNVQTFEIRGIVIDYSMAALTNPPIDGITDGLEARAIIADAPVDKLAVAMSVHFFTPVPPEQLEPRAKLEGIITAQLATNRFVLDERHVFRVSDSTRITGGTRADLAPNVAISLVGELTDKGIVLAEVIEIRGAVAIVPNEPSEPLAGDAYYDSF